MRCGWATRAWSICGTARLTLPMTTGREHCIDVRLGRLPLADIVRSIEELEAAMRLSSPGRSTARDWSTWNPRCQ